jgi:hypothetical protein
MASAGGGKEEIPHEGKARSIPVPHGDGGKIIVYY